MRERVREEREREREERERESESESERASVILGIPLFASATDKLTKGKIKSSKV